MQWSVTTKIWSMPYTNVQSHVSIFWIHASTAVQVCSKTHIGLLNAILFYRCMHRNKTATNNLTFCSNVPSAMSKMFCYVAKDSPLWPHSPCSLSSAVWTGLRFSLFWKVFQNAWLRSSLRQQVRLWDWIFTFSPFEYYFRNFHQFLSVKPRKK